MYPEILQDIIHIKSTLYMLCICCACLQSGPLYIPVWMLQVTLVVYTHMAYIICA